MNNLAAIRIDITWAKLGLDISPGRLQLNSESAGLEMDTKPAAIVDIELGTRLEIDWSQTRADIGLPSNAQRARQQTAKSEQKVLAGIARRCREGDRMADVHKEPDAIVNIAREASVEPVETNVAAIPKHPPKVKVDAIFRMEVAEGSVDIKAVPRKPEINYHRGQVQAYLRQRPEVAIHYVGNTLDIFR